MIAIQEESLAKAHDSLNPLVECSTKAFLMEHNRNPTSNQRVDREPESYDNEWQFQGSPCPRKAFEA